jgi:hypothetical protein
MRYKSTKKLPRLQRLETIIRRIRNSEQLWEENDIYHKRLGKLLEAARNERAKLPDTTPRGPYSGMTRRELAMTGTCEPDWY